MSYLGAQVCLFSKTTHAKIGMHVAAPHLLLCCIVELPHKPTGTNSHIPKSSAGIP